MTLLLETHVWLWSVLGPSKPGCRVREALRDGDSELWLSSISLWELVVLAGRGRFVVRGGLWN